MDVIPVIDVRHGLAVHAARGERSNYRPLQTPLAASSDPVAVAQGLRAAFTFPVLYVADLDGIEGRAPNGALLHTLMVALPGVTLWVDDGARVPDLAARAGKTAGVVSVAGSESLKSNDDVGVLRALPKSAYVLSLDFRGEDFIGPAAVLGEAEYWPDRVIVMTLARVGSGEGPDLRKMKDVVERAGARRVYAAGGVRDSADIAALQDIGAAGVLVASALHAKKITAGDLVRFAGR
jgi:phosphoribosylformimino-5-aminoimidazole carboxamide ribotide isomerase